MLKKLIFFLVAAMVLLSCNQNPKDNKDKTGIMGYWAFLDQYGNYNEAYFQEHAYVTINRFVQSPPSLRYKIKNDTLLINNDPNTDALSPIARLHWIDPDNVVIKSQFNSDTLERVNDLSTTLVKLDPKNDSVIFWTAFYDRYEKFLIKRGIITNEEAKAFRESQQIPEDVQSEINQ